MSEKVVPITGQHQSMQSMLATVMANEEAKRGFVVFFDKEGGLHFENYDLQLADVCMANTYFNALGVAAMNAMTVDEEDDE